MRWFLVKWLSHKGELFMTWHNHADITHRNPIKTQERRPVDENETTPAPDLTPKQYRTSVQDLPPPPPHAGGLFIKTDPSVLQLQGGQAGWLAGWLAAGRPYGHAVAPAGGYCGGLIYIQIQATLLIPIDVQLTRSHARDLQTHRQDTVVTCQRRQINIR